MASWIGVEDMTRSCVFPALAVFLLWESRFRSILLSISDVAAFSCSLWHVEPVSL